LETEAIETTYMSLGMQLKLVLGYIKDDVPDTELARRFLGEAKKTISELDRTVEELKIDFVKIDRKLGTDVARRASQLHELISSNSVDPTKGIVKVLEVIDENIIGNDIVKAAENLEVLKTSLEQKGGIAGFAQGINWEALADRDITDAVPDNVQASKEEGKKSSRKISLIYSASPENDYLVQGLVGKFVKKNDIEPIYIIEETVEGFDKLIEGSDTIVAFITKDMVKPEKRIPLVLQDNKKLVVYVESGADVPQEIKNRYELHYFSRDRTGELLLQVMEQV